MVHNFFCLLKSWDRGSGIPGKKLPSVPGVPYEALVDNSQLNLLSKLKSCKAGIAKVCDFPLVFAAKQLPCTLLECPSKLLELCAPSIVDTFEHII